MVGNEVRIIIKGGGRICNEIRIIIFCHDVGIIIVKEVRVCLVEVARMDSWPAHSAGWMCAAVGGCAGLLALVSFSSSLPFLLSWLPPSPPGVGLPRSLGVMLPNCILVLTWSLL